MSRWLSMSRVAESRYRKPSRYQKPSRYRDIRSTGLLGALVLILELLTLKMNVKENSIFTNWFALKINTVNGKQTVTSPDMFLVIMVVPSIWVFTDRRTVSRTVGLALNCFGYHRKTFLEMHLYARKLNLALIQLIVILT